MADIIMERHRVYHASKEDVITNYSAVVHTLIERMKNLAIKNTLTSDPQILIEDIAKLNA